MATGASTADLAIILIDARYGVQTKLVVIPLLQVCSVLKYRCCDQQNGLG